MKAPTVLCVATNVNENLLGFMRSLNRSNFSYRILGLGENWGGWSWRAKKYLEGLHALAPEDVVIICDAYDVFAVRPSSFIMSKFLSLNVDVIAGAEHCTGENMADLTGWYLYHEKEVHQVLPHLNAGFVMGKVFRLIEMYEFIMERDDDQIAMGEYFCTHPWRLAVDFDRQFVYNHQYKLAEDRTNSYFIHYPGYKYMPETTVAYMNRLKEMLAEEVGEYVKERMASSNESSDSDVCDFSLQNHSLAQQDTKSPGVCPLDSICNLAGSETQLDALAESAQMLLSLDQMAHGATAVAAATMPMSFEPAVLPTAHHEVHTSSTTKGIHAMVDVPNAGEPVKSTC